MQTTEEPIYELVEYHVPESSTRLKLAYAQETIWASQAQLTQLFGVGQSTISHHIKTLTEAGEIEPETMYRKSRYVASDGKSYEVVYYNMEVIWLVGGRVNSGRGMLFRKWGFQVVKEKMLAALMAMAGLAPAAAVPPEPLQIAEQRANWFTVLEYARRMFRTMETALAFVRFFNRNKRQLKLKADAEGRYSAESLDEVYNFLKEFEHRWLMEEAEEMEAICEHLGPGRYSFAKLREAAQARGCYLDIIKGDAAGNSRFGRELRRYLNRDLPSGWRMESRGKNRHRRYIVSRHARHF